METSRRYERVRKGQLSIWNFPEASSGVVEGPILDARKINNWKIKKYYETAPKRRR